MIANQRLNKKERLCSVTAIDRLFNAGSRSTAAFPIRMVYRVEERQAGQEPVQVLVTVSKRHFHHAVQRNRVKRQLREAYRRHKQQLAQLLAPSDKCVFIAFIWQDGKLWNSADIEKRLNLLLTRLSDKLSNGYLDTSSQTTAE